MGTIQITRLEWQESLRVVRKVHDMGVSFFDTARGYLDSELRLGEAFHGIRDQVVIITKSGKKNPQELSIQLDESLQRLRTDYVDIFLFHGAGALEEDGFFDPGGILETAQKAVEAGKVRFLGFSAHKVSLALKALEVESLQVGMVPANFISREYIDGGFYKKAKERNLGLLAMKPFGGGRIRNASVCLKFLRRYRAMFPCIGIEDPEEMRRNIEVWERKEPFTALEKSEMSRIHRELGDRFCRGCGYCLPCPQGIAIPTMTFLKVFSMQMPRDRVVTEKHSDAVERAADCTECGQCVERCPYDLDIPAMIKENRDFYLHFSS
jgi:predicted aldo/keto reductase-like oxidoreductase